MESQAFLGLFKKKDAEKLPQGAELQDQEAQAQAAFAAAQALAAAGRNSSAVRKYKNIVGDYPQTNAASEAQFQIGQLYSNMGKTFRAFDAYQGLIDNYRKSRNYGPAISQQFALAVYAKNNKKGRFLGVIPRFQDGDIVEMFQKVRLNGPQSKFAPESLFNIGEIYQDKKDPVNSVNAYQKLVDEYPRSRFASIAQKRIGDIRQGTIERGSNNPAELRQAIESYEDYQLQFPEGEDAPDVQANLSGLRTLEAKRSIEVARFYEKKGNLKAAAIYYARIVEDFPDSREFNKAAERLQAISDVDPDVLEKMPAVTRQAQPKVKKRRIVRARKDTKSKKRYMGPPARKKKQLRKLEKKSLPSMRVSPSAPKKRPAPKLPSSEPDLPSMGGEDLLLPPVVPGGGSLSSPKEDSLPEIPTPDVSPNIE